MEQLRFVSKGYDKHYCRILEEVAGIGAEWSVGIGGTAGGAGCRVGGAGKSLSREEH